MRSSKSVEVIDMARFDEFSTTVQFLLDLSLPRYVLETHRVWLDESLTLELYTVPRSGSSQ